jgi:predicted nucleotidyltransferase
LRTILKVLVGSQAHGLARAESDADYRGVFVVPTSALLSLGAKPQSTSWVEGGDQDDTQWELAHFLTLATHCNPNALEVFGAPVIEADDTGEELRSLLPYVWSSRGVWQSYSGYADNQWKKFFADKYGNERGRATKYALAAARSLMQGRHLLETGEMTVQLDADMRRQLLSFRDRLEEGPITRGQVLDHMDRLRTALWDAYQQNDSHEADLRKVNEFLLRVRRENW